MRRAVAIRYTYFEIENFKGVKALRLDLGSPPSAPIHTLVGLNESGKTTVLEAIDWFSGGRESLDPAELAGRTRAEKDDLIPIAEKANFNGIIAIRAGVEMDDEDIEALKKHLKKRLKYTLKEVSDTSFTVEDVNVYRDSSWLKREPQPAMIDGIGRSQRGKLDKKLSEHREAAAAASEFIRSRLPPIWYFPNFLFEFPSRIYLTDREEDTDRDRFYRALMQDVLDSLDNGANLERHMVERATSGSSSKQKSLRQLLLDMQRAITERIFKPWDGIFGQENDKEVILSCDYEAFEVAETGARYNEVYLEVQIKGNDGYFDVSERSLGFRWFFVFLLLTHFRGFRKGSSDVLFLFDEPASNLHPNAQAKLLESFAELTHRCVIVYTTHSHHMINPHWLENTFVVRNLGLEVETSITDYSARKTNIVVNRYREFAVEHPEQSHYFRPILDVLDYAPSRLETVPDAVMVEGKNDFYALSYMQDLILRDAGLDLALMPGMGAGGLDSLIRLYLGWGRPFIVVLDSDREGQKQRMRYMDKFGPVLDGKVFVLRDFVTRAPGDTPETLLTKADRSAIQGLAYPGEDYTKKKFYRSLQEALATGTIVPIGGPTQRRFQRILEGMATALAGNRQRSERVLG